MVLRTFNPSAVARPASRYSQGVEVPAGSRWLYISGQVGVAPDGAVRQGLEAQLEQTFANLEGVLAEAGMGKRDLVKLTVFVTQPGAEAVTAYRVARDRWLAGHEPAATYLVVNGLAHPDFLVEIEAVAAAS